MPRSEEKRVWLAGGLVSAVLIAATAWLVFIGPTLSSTSSLRADAETTQAQNAVLQARVAKLKGQNDNVGALQASLRDALAALPYDTGLPSFTRQVAAQATASGVGLTSITVGSVIKPTGTASGTTGTGSTAAPASIVAIPITLLSTGSAKQQAAFLRAIQVTGPRRSLVSSTVLSGGSASGSGSIDLSSTMTTQLQVFTAPLSAAAQAQLMKLLAAK